MSYSGSQRLAAIHADVARIIAERIARAAQKPTPRCAPITPRRLPAERVFA